MARPFLAGPLLIVLLLAGCGGAGSTHHTSAQHRASVPPLCDPNAREVMAQRFSIQAQTITLSKSIANSGYPQCSFTAHIAGDKRVVANVNYYDGPQPYFVLERTEVEASQPFTQTRLSPPPQAIIGLGLEADWFPAEQQMMATDGIRLITTSVVWRGSTERQRKALAEAMTRPYMKITKQGREAANGYP